MCEENAAVPVPLLAHCHSFKRIFAAVCFLKILEHSSNEMVSLGDTAISLHILQPPLTGGGVFWKVKTQSAKICLNFNFEGGGVVFWKVKTQSAKIWLNFNFRGGGGVLES